MGKKIIVLFSLNFACKMPTLKSEMCKRYNQAIIPRKMIFLYKLVYVPQVSLN